jgi:hypothetical protein
MLKLKNQIEEQLHEIVFFFSLLLSFTIFLGGILYFACSQESLISVLGSFGANIDQSLFGFLGYAFFYLSVIALHMGYIMNFHIFRFRDFKKEYPLLAYSFLSHTVILVLFANTLSVIQLSLEIPNSQALINGAGGYVGHLFSNIIYANIGIYGSLVSLLALMGVTALLGGFFELPDVIVAIKSGSDITRHYTTKSIKTINSSFLEGLQLIIRNNEGSHAHAGGFRSQVARISDTWAKANDYIIDYFHTHIKEETFDEKKENDKEANKKVEKKSVPVEKPIQLKSTVANSKDVQKVKSKKSASKKTVIKPTVASQAGVKTLKSKSKKK